MDFGRLEGDTRLRRGELDPRWLNAWLHKWLVKHAKEYAFKALDTEAWHWDFTG